MWPVADIGFDIVNISLIYTKTILGSLGTFYDLRDADHCQPYFRGATIPGSSIGDILPCVKPLFQLSSQNFTNERR